MIALGFCQNACFFAKNYFNCQFCSDFALRFYLKIYFFTIVCFVNMYAMECMRFVESYNFLATTIPISGVISNRKKTRHFCCGFFCTDSFFCSVFEKYVLRRSASKQEYFSGFFSISQEHLM